MPDPSAASLAISLASSYVGLVGAPYIALISAPELSAGLTGRAAEMGAMSGCGLVYRALAAAAFGAPFGLYPTGEAFEMIYAIAGGSPWHHTDPGCALYIPSLSAPPRLASALIWGEAPGFPAHVDACVEAIEEPDPYSSSAPPVLALSVIAGGQRVTPEDVREGRAPEGSEGSETVKRLERKVRWNGRAWVDEMTKRVLLGCVGAEEMGERYRGPL